MKVTRGGNRQNFGLFRYGTAVWATIRNIQQQNRVHSQLVHNSPPRLLYDNVMACVRIKIGRREFLFGSL
jgi:hypothetical protein